MKLFSKFGQKSAVRSADPGLRSALWCGLVFGLATVIVCLNIFPPASLEYEVRSEVILAAAQVPALEDACSSSQLRLETEPPEISLQQLEVLGVPKLDSTSSVVFRDAGELSRVVVHSTWNKRCTQEAHEDWIRGLAEPDASRLKHSVVARNLRFSSWELEAAQHYMQRQEFLAEKTAPEEGRVFELARRSSETRTSLASFGSSNQANRETTELQTSLDQKEAAHEAALQDWKNELSKSRGQFQLVESPQIQLRIGLIPTIILTSIFAVGLFSGSSAGWLYFRAQSGGVFDPQVVAFNLNSQGLPLSGAFEVPSPMTATRSVPGKLAAILVRAGKLGSQYLLQASEWILGFWIALLVLRVATDELWRSLFFDNPLVAIAQLIGGLP